MMFRDEGQTLLREIDSFSSGSRKRVEFDLVHYHVVIYRIVGQSDLIRVDLHERDKEPSWPKVAAELEALEAVV